MGSTKSPNTLAQNHQIYLQNLGDHQWGLPPSFWLFHDLTRTLINAGENTQRFALEHRFKLSRVNDIIITSVSSNTVGGLPGLLLSLDMGIGRASGDSVSGETWIQHEQLKFSKFWSETLSDETPLGCTGIFRPKRCPVLPGVGLTNVPAENEGESRDTKRLRPSRSPSSSPKGKKEPTTGPAEPAGRPPTRKTRRIRIFGPPPIRKYMKQVTLFAPMHFVDVHVYEINPFEKAPPTSDELSDSIPSCRPGCAQFYLGEQPISARGNDKRSRRGSNILKESDSVKTWDSGDQQNGSGIFVELFPLYRDSKSKPLSRNQSNADECDYNSEGRAGLMVFATCPSVAGRFDREKAVQLKVPVGPLFGQLKSGNSIQLSDGTTVRPEDVLGQTINGVSFLMLDCPTQESVVVAIEQVQLLLSTVDDYTEVAFVCHMGLGSASHTQSSQFHHLQALLSKLPSPKGTDSGPIQLFAHSEPNDRLTQSPACGAAGLQMLLQKLLPSLFPTFAPPVVDAPKVALPSESLACRYRPRPLTMFQLAPHPFFSTKTPTKKGADTASCATPWVIPGPKLENKLPDDKTARLNSLEVEVKQCHDAFRSALESYASSAGLSLPKASDDAQFDPLIDFGRVLPLPAITFFGTGAAMPSKYRNVSGIRLEVNPTTAILMDCGEGTLTQLHLMSNSTDDFTRQLENIRVVLISHRHADHHLGLPNVLAARNRLCGNVCGQSNRIQHPIVIGPQRVLQYLAFYNSHVHPIPHTPVPLEPIADAHRSDRQLSIEAMMNNGDDEDFTVVHDIEPDCVEDLGGLLKRVGLPEDLKIGVCEVHHMLRFVRERRFAEQDMMPSNPLLAPDAPKNPPIDNAIKHEVPPAPEDKLAAFGAPRLRRASDGCFAFKVAGGSFNKVTDSNGWNHNIVYSGDTRPCGSLVELGRGCDVLIHEATFEEKMIQEARAKRHSTTSEAVGVAQEMDCKHLILSHFSQRYPLVSGPMTIGY
eukprot:GHVN01002112.1.p2 GENE.GHVN01002112.1~~GHVN01002112.1.p2  ORF type:complete len:987 (+),score=120.25 GHVN01002112.1:5159-8119(+)